MHGRNTITLAFIRVCRDSQFKLEFERAAALAAGTLGISPLEVWVACGSMEDMRQIAAGTHPYLKILEAAEADKLKPADAGPANLEIHKLGAHANL